MTANLMEFFKVLTVVFGTSFMIFSVKKAVLGFDSDRKEKENKEPADVINLQSDVDAIDNDGMGNQGRFPRRVNFK